MRAWPCWAWLPILHGQLALMTAFSPRDWHVHEMLYGYVPAVVTGFLLTAIPNWTGRLPLQGRPLMALIAVWVAGRLAISTSAWTGWIFAAAIDAAFLLVIAGAAAREIIAGRNWRNVKVLILLSLLLAGNIGFHVEVQHSGIAEYIPASGLPQR